MVNIVESDATTCNEDQLKQNNELIGQAGGNIDLAVTIENLLYHSQQSPRKWDLRTWKRYVFKLQFKTLAVAHIDSSH
jgi:hypothetical protein